MLFQVRCREDLIWWSNDFFEAVLHSDLMFDIVRLEVFLGVKVLRRVVLYGMAGPITIKEVSDE